MMSSDRGKRADQHPVVEFSWSAHPAREQPRRTAVAVVIIAAIGGVVFTTFRFEGWPVLESLSAGAVAALIVVLALHRFFFPSRYEVDERGIRAVSMLTNTRIDWWRVKRFLHDSRGGYLSPNSARSRADAFRGVHLLFGDDEDERTHIIAEIRRRIDAARGESEESFNAADRTSEKGRKEGTEDAGLRRHGRRAG